MPKQHNALFLDEFSQTDTLNPTQVQSPADAHVASTWTELKGTREKDPKNKRENSVSNGLICVVSGETCKTAYSKQHVCLHVCVCGIYNILHMASVREGELSSPMEKNRLFVDVCWLRLCITMFPCLMTHSNKTPPMRLPFDLAFHQWLNGQWVGLPAEKCCNQTCHEYKQTQTHWFKSQTWMR